MYVCQYVCFGGHSKASAGVFLLPIVCLHVCMYAFLYAFMYSRPRLPHVCCLSSCVCIHILVYPCTYVCVVASEARLNWRPKDAGAVCLFLGCMRICERESARFCMQARQGALYTRTHIHTHTHTHTRAHTRIAHVWMRCSPYLGFSDGGPQGFNLISKYLCRKSA